MSNVPLPEPHHQSAANFNAPDEPFYTADQMHAHAAAVSAAKDKEMAQLRAELIKSLADNAALRADAIDRQNNVVAPLRAEVAGLREELEAARQVMRSVRVFVTSREKIKHPEGTEWFDSAVTAIDAALAARKGEAC